MRTIYAEYNINHDSIDVYTSAGYMLLIDCWEAEKKFKNHIWIRMCAYFIGCGWAFGICKIISWWQFTDVGGCRRFTWIIGNLNKSLYLIFDYPYEHFTFKHFEKYRKTLILPLINEPWYDTKNNMGDSTISVYLPFFIL